MSQARCPNCFAPAAPAARFCEYCGKPLAAPAPVPPHAPAVHPQPQTPPGGGGLTGFLSKAATAINTLSNTINVVETGLDVLNAFTGGDLQRILHPGGYEVVTGACRRDREDPRDIVYDRHNDVSPGDLPAHVDLRDHLTPVEDQGHLGSCTANAIAGAYEYLHKRIRGANVRVSRLFIYYLERDLEGSVNRDSGAELRDGIKVLRKFGVCREDLWPYNVHAFRERPPEHAFEQATDHVIDEYHRVPVELHAMKACLAEGYPFVFGMELFRSFESSGRHGRIPMPRSGEGKLGGHAMLCCGYSDRDQVFLVRNSWGPHWGDGGYCYVPYRYLANAKLTNDCWTVRRAHNLDFTVTDGGAGRSFFGNQVIAIEDGIGAGEQAFEQADSDEPTDLDDALDGNDDPTAADDDAVDEETDDDADTDDADTDDADTGEDNDDSAEDDDSDDDSDDDGT